MNQAFFQQLFDCALEDFTVFTLDQEGAGARRGDDVLHLMGKELAGFRVIPNVGFLLEADLTDPVLHEARVPESVQGMRTGLRQGVEGEQEASRDPLGSPHQLPEGPSVVEDRQQELVDGLPGTPRVEDFEARLAYKEALEEHTAVKANQILLIEEASVQIDGLEEVRSHLQAAVLAAGGMVAEPGLVPVGGDLD